MGRERAKICILWLRSPLFIILGSWWDRGGSGDFSVQGWSRGLKREGWHPYGMGKASDSSIAIWSLGPTPGLQFPEEWDSHPACKPPVGSRRLPEGREGEMFFWPSLVIRPFNCNYFYN